MSRRLTISLAISSALFVSTPSAGTAYRFHAFKWPGGVVPYFNAAPDQAWAVSQAVSAWNRSGAHVRFVAVPRASARLVIEEHADKVYCGEGIATVGFGHGARVLIFPAHGLTHACNPYWAARVMAHELGHVLGLEHEDRYCAAMNATGNMRGGHECPQVIWGWRCRLLEPDDIAGIVAAYGGTAAKPTYPDICPLYRAIDPPTSLAGTSNASSGTLTLTFRRPTPPVIPSFVIPVPWNGRDAFVISHPAHTCTLAAATVPSQLHYRWDVQPGQLERITVRTAAAGDCLAVWALDELGRPSGRPATIVRAP